MTRTKQTRRSAALGLTCAAALSLPGAARADFGIGIFGGGKFYSEDGRLGRRLALESPDLADTAFNPSGIFGLRLGYLPIPRLAIELEAAISPSTTRGRMPIDGTMIDESHTSVAVAPLRAHLLVNILTGRIRPFVLLGGGGQLATPLAPGIIQSDAVGALHAGAGVTVGIKKDWGVRVEGRYLLAEGIGSPLTSEGELLFAFWGRFGGKPQASAPEPAPAPAPAAKVPPAPPPVDVPQPAQPVNVDADGDGVPDKEDQCPAQAGPAESRGCPDTDRDGDGVIDRLDRCPDQPESKNGFEDEDGCPDEVPQALQKITGALPGIGFETGQGALTKGSAKALDPVVQVLKDHPAARLEIGGHTDSSGDAAKNRALSQERAEAVRRYLVEQGVAPERLKAVGYGPDKPVADNGTPEGRSKNRRIELTLQPAR